MDVHALLELVNVPRAEWSFPILPTRQVIGRAAGASISLPANHRSVSRRHAEIWSAADGIRLCDLGSRGGTRVNGI